MDPTFARTAACIGARPIMTETTWYTGLVPHPASPARKGGAAEIIERCHQGPFRRRDHGRLKQSQHTLAIGLPERTRRAPRISSSTSAREESVASWRERDRMRGADQTNRDG